MTNRLIDYDALATACTDGDLDAFGAAALGWRLTDEARGLLLRALEDTNFHRTYEYGKRAFSLAQALALITDAATNASGIAVTEQVRTYRLGKEVAIAFRHDGKVHFGVRYASNLPMGPSQLWPELKPWAKVLDKNRARLEAWCATDGDKVAFPLEAAPVSTGNASVGAELLAAIIADPDDVARRLVYADWLVEQGNAQGELIQLCEQRRALGKESPRLERQIKELEARYREPIAGEIAQLAAGFRLERGFVAMIEIAAPTFAKHGERLMAQHPIEELFPKPVNAEALARLATAPALRKLRRLRLGQYVERLRPIPLDKICGSTLFESLRDFQIWTWQTEGDPTQALASMQAPRLESMSLYAVDSAPRIVAGLAQNPSLRLRHLELSSRPMEWPKRALAAPAFDELGTLELSIYGSQIVDLIEGATLPSLRELGVYEELPIDRVAFPSLQTLRYYGDADARAAIALVERHPRLSGLLVRTMAPDDVDRLLAHLLSLPNEHPFRAFYLPTAEADPTLVARAHERFRLLD